MTASEINDWFAVIIATGVTGVVVLALVGFLLVSAVMIVAWVRDSIREIWL